jgi:hypothetical protein
MATAQQQTKTRKTVAPFTNTYIDFIFTAGEIPIKIT